MARKKKAPATEAPAIAEINGQSSDLAVGTEENLQADTVNGLASAPVAESVPVHSPVAAAKERITVVLDARGGLDVDGMRDATKQRLVAALKKSSGDLLPKLPDAPIKRWPEIAVRAIYSFLGAAESSLAAKRYPMEVAVAAFTYTDADMEALMEPTQAVLSKHAGKLDRWQEETTLILAISQVHFAKLHALKQFMAEYQLRQENAGKTPGPAPSGSTVAAGLQ